MRSMLLGQYKEFVAAVTFLSVLPMPGRMQLFQHKDASPSRSVGSAYFPLVGLLLGLLLWLLVLVFAPLVPQFALAGLLVVALVLLTGGLHLDGLMDTCDGILGGATRERKLEIMRDSRVGSFGVLAGACALLLKFAFFASLGEHTLPLALLVTLPSARWAMVLALRIFPGARPSGLGATFRQAVTSERVALAGMIALVIVLIAGQWIGLVVWATSSAVALVLGFWMTSSLGGLTGDCYGAIAEVAEVASLLVLVMLRA